MSDTLAERALFELQKVANDTSRILYDRKHAVYGLLRCGVKVRPEAGENTVTMWLVNWADLLANDCPVAEEVTVPGGELVSGAKASTKRPTVSVSEGIRQNLDNRKKKYIQPFFSTSVTPQGHPTGDPTDRLERQVLGSLQRRLHGCLVGVGAEPLAYDSDEFTAVEVFLMQLAASMEIDTPAVRP